MAIWWSVKDSNLMGLNNRFTVCPRAIRDYRSVLGGPREIRTRIEQRLRLLPLPIRLAARNLSESVSQS
jgi:hypothetical protein